MRLETPSDGSQILETLDLEGFRCGRQFTRDQRNWKTGEFWVRKLWYARIMPSFGPHAELICASAKDVKHERESQPDWHRATLTWTPEGHQPSSVTCDIETDPVAEAVQNLTLLPTDGAVSLDGIGYFLALDTIEVTSKVTFSNPRSKSWRLVEAALIDTVAVILDTQPRSHGKKLLETFRRYTQRDG